MSRFYDFLNEGRAPIYTKSASDILKYFQEKGYNRDKQLLFLKTREKEFPECKKALEILKGNNIVKQKEYNKKEDKTNFIAQISARRGLITPDQKIKGYNDQNYASEKPISREVEKRTKEETKNAIKRVQKMIDDEKEKGKWGDSMKIEHLTKRIKELKDEL